MAVTPFLEQNDSGSYGSFTFAGQNYDVTDDMVFGTPPVDENDPDLPGHGIFPTYYGEKTFTFDSNSQTETINVQDNSVQGDAPFLYYADFSVDVSNLADNYQIHFDLYTLNSSGNLVKAPFSHDAESSGDHSQIPEPATMLLMGFGLIGLANIGRKKKA